MDLDVSLIGDTTSDGVCNQNTSGGRCPLYPGGNIDPIAKDIIIFKNDFSGVDTYRQFILVRLMAGFHNFDRRTNGIGCRRKGGHHPISKFLDPLSTVFSNYWFMDCPVFIQNLHCLLLIPAHQSGKADDIGEHDGSELAGSWHAKGNFVY